MRSDASPSPEAPIRVVIADDSDLMRDTLVRSLARSLRLEIVASAADADGLLAAMAAHHPDVVLMDLRLGDRWGLELVPAVQETTPNVQVVVYSAVADAETADACRQVGVFRQLVKGCPLADVEQAITDAARS